MTSVHAILKVSIAAILFSGVAVASVAQLSTDARTAIPHNVQQLLVVDYKAMQNSTAAMELRNRVMPPELKPFDEALQKSGLNDNHDVEQLAFALFRPNDSEDQLQSVGVAQGQFPIQQILGSFRKQRFKATVVRSNHIYPLAKTGMVACFIDSSTMVFGSSDAVKAALDARDGVAPSLLTNAAMMDAMKSVDSEPLWSILDQKGTQFMMRQVLGSAGSVTDFETSAGLLVFDGLSARRQVRSHHFDWRFVCRVHTVIPSERGRDGSQDGGFGRRETSTERYVDSLRCRTDLDPLCGFRHGVLRATAFLALPGHVVLRCSSSEAENGKIRHLGEVNEIRHTGP
jgi:hypothetical protein